MAKKTIGELAMILTRHSDDLQRFAAGLSEDAVEDFAATEDAIYELIYKIEVALKEGVPNDFKTQRKLDELKEKLAEIRNGIKEKILEDLQKQSSELIDNESDFILLFSAGLLGLSLVSGAGISKADNAKIAKYGKYHGLTQKQILSKVIDGDIDRIYEAISFGLKNRDSLEKIRDSVKSEMLKTRRYIKSEIDSIVNGVANDASLAAASKNQMSLVYATMLDSRVCEDCSDYEGMVYEYDSPDIPALPQHIGCRCRLVPVSDDSDIPASDLYVLFPEYFESLNANEKKERIGSLQYKEYLSGALKISGFIDPPASARLSIAEISERDQKAFS